MFFVSILCLWGSNYAYVPILSTHVQNAGASLTMAGAVIAAYGLVQNIARIPIGMASDIFKRRKVFMVSGLFCSLASALGFYLLRTPGAMLISRSLSGLSVSSWAIFTATFAGLYDDSDNARAIGMATGLMAAGQLAGVFFGGIAAAGFGASGAFLLSAALGLAGLFIVILLPEAPARERAPFKAADILHVLTDRTLLFFSAVAALLQYVNTSILTGFLPTALHGLGASNALMSIGTTAALLPMTIAAPLAGTRLKRMLGSRRLLICGFALLSLPMFLVPFIKSPALFLAAMFIAGAGRGISFGTTMSLATGHLPDSRRSTAMAVYQAIYGIGMWVGPLVTGIVSDASGMGTAFVSNGILGFAAIAALLIFDFSEAYGK